uniref:Uncharacterized protein n=1 Tax=Timema bartmani TaxID=61472 RepID=A0A7R9F7V9_9NEOP|nr:unnamed protein product [Timema bartmani]
MSYAHQCVREEETISWGPRCYDVVRGGIQGSLELAPATEGSHISFTQPLAHFSGVRLSFTRIPGLSGVSARLQGSQELSPPQRVHTWHILNCCLSSRIQRETTFEVSHNSGMVSQSSTKSLKTSTFSGRYTTLSAIRTGALTSTCSASVFVSDSEGNADERAHTLTQQSHSESEVKEDDDHETEVSLDMREPMEEGHDTSRRKKKKKRRKKVETKASRRSSEDNMEADDIYDLPLDPEMPELSHLPSMESASSINELLQVMRKSLNPNTELKKKFGSRIVEGERSKRRGRGYVKSSWLVSPRDNWPPATKIGQLENHLGETTLTAPDQNRTPISPSSAV